jgi:hypothetical protein
MSAQIHLFGTAHSDWTVVPCGYTNTLGPHLSLSVFLSAHTYIYAAMSENNITAYVNSSFTFGTRLITSNYSPIRIVVYRFFFFTLIVRGDANLRFSFILATITNAVEEETRLSVWLYHRCNQSIHVTDGVTATPLSARLTQCKCGLGSSAPSRFKPKIIPSIRKVV